MLGQIENECGPGLPWAGPTHSPLPGPWAATHVQQGPTSSTQTTQDVYASVTENNKTKTLKEIHNQLPPPPLPLLPPYISSFKSCSLKKKKKRKVCRLFSLFIISWRLSRAQRKNGKCPQVIAKSAQITFFFTYIFFDVDSFCPPPPFQCFNKKKKENNFAAVL